MTGAALRNMVADERKAVDSMIAVKMTMAVSDHNENVFRGLLDHNQCLPLARSKLSVVSFSAAVGNTPDRCSLFDKQIPVMPSRGLIWKLSGLRPVAGSLCPVGSDWCCLWNEFAPRAFALCVPSHLGEVDVLHGS